MNWVDVKISDSSLNESPGRAAVQQWNSKQAFIRGFKRSARVVVIVALVALPFAIIEPFIFMIWGSILGFVLLFVVGPFLHMKYWEERSTFLYVEGQCPHCKHRGQLKPYLSTAFRAEGFTALCPTCGQTVRCSASVES